MSIGVVSFVFLLYLQVLCPNCHSLTENFGSRNTNAPRGKSKYYGKAKAD